MKSAFERRINYYETDKMGVVHHSNYIRYLEEARGKWMDEIGMPFIKLEERNMTIPVLGVNCKYKHHVTFDDVIVIKVFLKKYNGVRLTVGYDVREKKTGQTVIIAETEHCFTNNELKPINLKKHAKDFDEILERELQELAT